MHRIGYIVFFSNTNEGEEDFVLICFVKKERVEIETDEWSVFIKHNLNEGVVVSVSVKRPPNRVF